MNRKTTGCLGIISCRLFEDELVHILLRDREIERLFLVENDDSQDLFKKLKQAEPRFEIVLVKEEDLLSITVPEGYSVNLWIKPMALHQKPEELKEEILRSIRIMQEHSKAVLLFYGLCGNAFRKIGKLTEEFSVPVTILRDAQGLIVDDCIGTVLGGTSEYYEQLRKSSGTFFLTPMWAGNWRELFHKVQILADSSDIEGARYIFECVGYKNVIKLDTGLGDQEDFERNIEEFATLFNFKRGVVDCTLSVVERSYDQAKLLL
jgi:hypothetical protein